MRVLITAFICISLYIANSNGSNSSLLEGKVKNAIPSSSNFRLPYTVTIASFTPCFHILGMGALFDPSNVITSKDIAKFIDTQKEVYYVFLSGPNPRKPYEIDSVFFKENTNTVIPMEFGILKLKRRTPLKKERHIQFVDIYENPHTLDTVFHSKGWTYVVNKPRVRNDDIDKETANAEKHPEMYREDNYYSDEEPEVNPWEKVYVQYITVKLIEAEKCKKLVETVFKRPYELGMICAISLDGYFESHEVGAPVFLDESHLLGITLHSILHHGSQVSIVTLIEHKLKYFTEFAKKPPSSPPTEDENVGSSGFTTPPPAKTNRRDASTPSPNVDRESAGTSSRYTQSEPTKESRKHASSRSARFDGESVPTKDENLGSSGFKTPPQVKTNRRDASTPSSNADRESDGTSSSFTQSAPTKSSRRDPSTRSARFDGEFGVDPNVNLKTSSSRQPEKVRNNRRDASTPSSHLNRESDGTSSSFTQSAPTKDNRRHASTRFVRFDGEFDKYPNVDLRTSSFRHPESVKTNRRDTSTTSSRFDRESVPTSSSFTQSVPDKASRRDIASQSARFERNFDANSNVNLRTSSLRQPASIRTNRRDAPTSSSHFDTESVPATVSSFAKCFKEFKVSGDIPQPVTSRLSSRNSFLHKMKNVLTRKNRSR